MLGILDFSPCGIALMTKEPKHKRTTRKPISKRATFHEGSGLYAKNLYLTPQDDAKVDAIDKTYCCDSVGRVARLAINRWHSYLIRQSSRPGWTSPERPEFKQEISKIAEQLRRVYWTKQDVKRINALMDLTGVTVENTLVRAAIGWMYETMDV